MAEIKSREVFLTEGETVTIVKANGERIDIVDSRDVLLVRTRRGMIVQFPVSTQLNIRTEWPGM